MATASSHATAPKNAPAARRVLAEELVRLRADHAAVYAREKELKAALTKAAGEAGENFQERFEGLGVVKVSAPKEARCKGTAPEVVVEAFLALPEKRRDKLVEDGIIKIAEQWTNPYYGSVTVDLF
jgi:hypothetical protein